VTTEDREVLRTAGERLGTLAEQAKERWDVQKHPREKSRAWERYLHLSSLSKDVLRIANHE